nr:hypothetical transcript [Hymenolepis microstoma]
MGKLGDWTNTHIKLCTIISACLIVVSLILIIAGAVLVGLSGGEWRVGKETYEEFTERQSAVLIAGDGFLSADHLDAKQAASTVLFSATSVWIRLFKLLTPAILSPNFLSNLFLHLPKSSDIKVVSRRPRVP